MKTKTAIEITCEHCNAVSVADMGDLVCENPDCGAPLRPHDDLLLSLFGKSVEVLSRPLSAVWRVAVGVDVLPLDKMAAHIIDISKWQYKYVNTKWVPPDFAKMANDTDTIYVTHKASQGTFADPCYFMGVLEMRQADIKYGTYHYCDPYYDAVQSAVYYASQINTIPEDEQWGTDVLPQHWVDVETRRGSRTSNLTNLQLTHWVKTFVDTLRRLTDQPFGIYTRKWFWDSYIERNNWAHLFPLWIARYNSWIAEPGEPSDWSRFGCKPVLWQRDADGNGLGSDYGVWSNSIDRNRSPLLTREEIMQIIGKYQPEPPEPPIATDLMRTLFTDQAFRSEPTTKAGEITIIKRLPKDSVLRVAPCETMQNKSISITYSATQRDNEIWLHCIDESGVPGWLAAYHAQSRSTVYVEDV